MVIHGACRAASGNATDATAASEHPGAAARRRSAAASARAAAQARERVGALRNLPPFLKLVWQASPGLTLFQCVLRAGAR